MRALRKLVQPIAKRQDTFVSHSHGTSTSAPQPSSAAISAASRNMLRASHELSQFVIAMFVVSALNFSLRQAQSRGRRGFLRRNGYGTGWPAPRSATQPKQVGISLAVARLDSDINEARSQVAVNC